MMKIIREDNRINTAIELMQLNDQFQGEALLGPFWYDPDKKELFGVKSSLAIDNEFYQSKQFWKAIKTDRRLHKDIWKKEQHRGKDSRFKKNHTLIPRGRVFEFEDEGYKVCVGSWINKYPEAKEEILYEFNLPQDTEFIIDRHWEIGRGFSDEF